MIVHVAFKPYFPELNRVLNLPAMNRVEGRYVFKENIREGSSPRFTSKRSSASRLTHILSYTVQPGTTLRPRTH